MLNIAVLFGGVSCEHDISIITALQILNNIKGHNVYPVYIHTDGLWYCGNQLKDINIYKNFDGSKKGLNSAVILPCGKSLYFRKKNKLKEICRLDAAIIAMHGLNGEDGSIAGLLQLAGIPQTACGIAASGIGMDKIASKIFFKGLGLDILPYTYINRKDYMFAPLDTMLGIEKEIEYPVMVKPCMLGSSIGINKCENRQQLAEAIETAMRFDSRIIFEKAVSDFTEINCSALKVNDEIRVTECEKPVNWKNYLKFEDKYIGTKGMAGIQRVFPADIDAALSQKIKQITAKIYSGLNLKGIIRADFIISNKIYINEINTVPGSLSYYLWDYEGIKFSELIDIIINEACRDFREFNKSTYSFKSNIFNIYGSKGAKGVKNI